MVSGFTENEIQSLITASGKGNKAALKMLEKVGSSSNLPSTISNGGFESSKILPTVRNTSTALKTLTPEAEMLASKIPSTFAARAGGAIAELAELAVPVIVGREIAIAASGGRDYYETKESREKAKPGNIIKQLDKLDKDLLQKADEFEKTDPVYAAKLREIASQKNDNRNIVQKGISGMVETMPGFFGQVVNKKEYDREEELRQKNKKILDNKNSGGDSTPKAEGLTRGQSNILGQLIGTAVAGIGSSLSTPGKFTGGVGQNDRDVGGTTALKTLEGIQQYQTEMDKIAASKIKGSSSGGGDSTKANVSIEEFTPEDSLKIAEIIVKDKGLNKREVPRIASAILSGEEGGNFEPWNPLNFLPGRNASEYIKLPKKKKTSITTTDKE